MEENEITEIPYEEGSIEKVEEITAEGEDDDDDDDEESSDSEQAEEELVPPSGEQVGKVAKMIVVSCWCRGRGALKETLGVGGHHWSCARSSRKLNMN